MTHRVANVSISPSPFNGQEELILKYATDLHQRQLNAEKVGFIEGVAFTIVMVMAILIISLLAV